MPLRRAAHCPTCDVTHLLNEIGAFMVGRHGLAGALCDKCQTALVDAWIDVPKPPALELGEPDPNAVR